MKFRFACSVIIGLFFWVSANAQQLKPGFDPDEYTEVLIRCADQANRIADIKPAHKFAWVRVYRAQETGLHNRWDLWLNSTKTQMAINIRGTAPEVDSWIENFYSAMIPAQGTMKISDSNTFDYKFAGDPKAMVHVGWAMGAGSMAPAIITQIQKYYQQGIKQVIVEGHSQGGAISFLLSAYLHYQIAAGKLPADLVIKTYSSAAPKPGNLYFAYDYDYNNRDGWAFTVVNAADWVPETPFSIQTLNDVNDVSPFTQAKATLKKQKFFVRVYLHHIYRELSHATFKSQRKYEKYLGKKAAKYVKKYLPGFEPPKYTHSANYMRAGTSIVLEPDEQYYKLFPNDGKNLFINHLFKPYYYLLQQAYPGERK
jgi:hypothetical protein